MDYKDWIVYEGDKKVVRERLRDRLCNKPDSYLPDTRDLEVFANEVVIHCSGEGLWERIFEDSMEEDSFEDSIDEYAEWLDYLKEPTMSHLDAIADLVNEKCCDMQVVPDTYTDPGWIEGRGFDDFPLSEKELKNLSNEDENELSDKNFALIPIHYFKMKDGEVELVGEYRSSRYKHQKEPIDESFVFDRNSKLKWGEIGIVMQTNPNAPSQEPKIKPFTKEPRKLDEALLKEISEKVKLFSERTDCDYRHPPNDFNWWSGAPCDFIQLHPISYEAQSWMESNISEEDHERMGKSKGFWIANESVDSIAKQIHKSDFVQGSTMIDATGLERFPKYWNQSFRMEAWKRQQRKRQRRESKGSGFER